VLQCVAVCCSVLQCVAVCCSVLQSLDAVLMSPLPRADSPGVWQCVAVIRWSTHVAVTLSRFTCSVLQCAAVFESVLQCVAVIKWSTRVAVTLSRFTCGVLQCVAVCCSASQSSNGVHMSLRPRLD